MPNEKKNRNDIEELSTDKILEEIEQDKKQVKRSSILAISALIAIVALCIAWFASNNWVKGVINGVSIEDDNPFVLASVGERQSAEKDYLKDEEGKNILFAGWEKEYGAYIDNKTGKKTEKKQTYHLGNSSLVWYLNGQESLVPGNGGKMEFYLIPKKDGLRSVTISLDMTGYTVPENGNRAEKVENNKIQNLIDGHILLFQNLDDTYGYTGWLGTDSSFTVNAPSEYNGGKFEKDVPYKVTFYWVWPRYFRNYIYTQRSTQEDLFTDKINQGAGSEYDQLIGFINNRKSLGETGVLFYSETADSPEISENINNQMSDTVLDQCNQYYNQADEYIGKNVKYIYVEMKIMKVE